MNRMNRISLRKAFPLLFWEIAWIGLGQLVLAWNFWFSNPSFNPYNISKYIIGVVFFVLGATLLFFLRHRALLKIRTWMAAMVFFILAWAGGNTQQWFDGKSSLQLPIVFVFFGVGWLFSIMYRLTTASKTNEVNQ